MSLIDISGMGHSGKSTVNCYLSEFEGLNVHPPGYEFNLFRLSGGLYSLDQAFRNLADVQSFDYALNVSSTLINNILPSIPSVTITPAEAKWFLRSLTVGRVESMPWHDLAYAESSKEFYLSKFKKTIFGSALLSIKQSIPFLNKMNFREVSFPKLDHCSYWIEDFLNYLFTNGKTVVNNLFGPNISPEQLALIPSLKSIFVLRDPRDIIASIGHDERYVPAFESASDHEQQLLKQAFVGKNDVDFFIAQQKVIRERVSRLCPTQSLVISFEDFCLNYDEISKRLNDFLEIRVDQQVAKFKNFDPTKSKLNIGLHKTYHDQKVIRKVADELETYLYE